MKHPFSLAILLLIIPVVAWGYSPPPYEDAGQKQHEDIDTALIIGLHIRKVKEVRTTEQLERQRWDWDGPENNTHEINQKTTWTTFDQLGRVVAIDDTLVSDTYDRAEITHETFTYSGSKVIERQLTLHFLYDKFGPKDSIVRLEVVKWNDKITWRKLEWADYGQWIVHIDSTVLNNDGSPHITYTYNSMGDSFVEEFVYDAKARLKYRRLSMKQFWSPPWEMESSIYAYQENGSYVQRDSVWRIDPDMKLAVQRAGDRNTPGYAWRVLLNAPSTGSFNRLESWEDFTYDDKRRLVRQQTWTEYAHSWSDYSWNYNAQGQIARETEWRCTRWSLREEPETGNKDSVWYTYENGILSMREDWHANGVEVEKSKTKFGKQDPNRTEISDYRGKENYVKVHKRYEEDMLMETMYYDSDGLKCKWVGCTNTYVLSDERTYTYSKW